MRARRQICRALFTLLMVGSIMAVVPVPGFAQGNSATATQCQQGGYLDLMTSDGELFENTGQCAA
jgi:biotin carboxylase